MFVFRLLLAAELPLNTPGRHFGTSTPCSTCSSSTFAPLWFRLSNFQSACHSEIRDGNDRNLLFAPEQELHSGNEHDRQSSEEDQNLVPVLVFRGVVGWEEYHCKRLAKSNRSNIEVERTRNPKHPGIRYHICHSNEELSQVWVCCI